MYPSFDMILHREHLLKDIQAKKRKVKEVAEILGVKRETVSRWLAKYRFEGLDGICPKKPGPKEGSLAVNRTEENTEDIVCVYGKRYPFNGQNYRKLKRKKQMYCLNELGDEIQLDVCLPFGRARNERVFDAIDDCSRLVYARLMPDHTQESAIEFVDELILAMPFTIKAIRTDCGSEFSKDFTEHLKNLGIEHRKNAPYTPQHNGKIERYHRTFKEKEAYSWHFNASIDDLNYRLTLWLHHYNFNMRHGGLGMNRLTPAKKALYSSIQKSLQPHLKNVTGTLQLNKN